MRRHAAWMLPAALLALSCSNQTAGNPFQVPFSISGLERPDAGPLFFTTPLNWAVQLDAAQIYLGPFYFNIDPPEQGVYRSGVVIAQSLLQVTVDTLNPSLVPVPGGVNGETGTSIGPAVAVDLTCFHRTRPLPTPTQTRAGRRAWALPTLPALPHGAASRFRLLDGLSSMRTWQPSRTRSPGNSASTVPCATSTSRRPIRS